MLTLAAFVPVGRVDPTSPSFVDQTLPRKLPPRMEDVPRTDVSSVVGMLAASVQGIIEAALRALSSQRLRHPACSTSSTALKYIGLYMKANNPDNTPYQAAKYKAKLEGFLDECGLAPFIYFQSRRNIIYRQYIGIQFKWQYIHDSWIVRYQCEKISFYACY